MRGNNDRVEIHRGTRVARRVHGCAKRNMKTPNGTKMCTPVKRTMGGGRVVQLAHSGFQKPPVLLLASSPEAGTWNGVYSHKSACAAWQRVDEEVQGDV